MNACVTFQVSSGGRMDCWTWRSNLSSTATVGPSNQNKLDNGYVTVGQYRY